MIEMPFMCRARGSRAVYIIDGLHKRGPLSQTEVDAYAFLGIANGRHEDGTTGEVDPVLLDLPLAQ